jgi:sec-independent protein translocase protein TatA
MGFERAVSPDDALNGSRTEVSAGKEGVVMLAVGPFGVGPFEAILILVIVTTIFGVGRLPEVGGAIGRSIREFRRAARGPEEPPSPSGKDDTAAQTGGSG